jgi:hypothetical protein
MLKTPTGSFHMTDPHWSQAEGNNSIALLTFMLHGYGTRLQQENTNYGDARATEQQRESAV